ncbi:acyl-CoA dehydrogenase family protein [Cupriavidus necator]|uniref:Acyl-CoA dehydrogenase n=1 Tax=Cupriavidus necator TaxID=106590 RepID=A0A367PEA2_CUPNE|nr:acyl-CoA dehydrogenase family protein [Cupriavidus necator]QQX87865.1 acyl-CoA dehydrogenase family protein [Cupriavidus necator]RCJ06200.1 acyl-CoA dehydrogenase [Cupriavidus necator]
MQRLIFEAEHDAFRESARRFYQREVGPHGERWREQGCVDREVFRKAGEQGYLLMWADEKYGGAGVEDFRYEQILIEENARHGDSGFFGTLHSRLVAPYIGRIGNEEQRQRLLPAAARGESIFAIAMTEPQAGSDLAGMRTRAEDHGDHWVLNGAKTYISNGQLADYVVVVARTDPERSHGLGLFIVERGMPGFERGRKLRKMGLHSQDTSELFFDNVKVPKANVLGEPGQGFRYLTRHLAEERLIGACGYMASAQVAFDLTLDYVKERKAFGRAIGTFQNSRFKLAELRAQLDALQTFVDQCVLQHNAGTLTVETAASAKLLTSELQGRMVDEGVQLHGGAGYMEEYRICRMYTDARISRIYAGSSEIMKEIIGRSLGLDDRVKG